MSQSRTLPAPLRPKWLIVSLSICSFMLLGSMATMSLSIGVVIVGVIGGFGDPKRFAKHFKAQFEHKLVRRYLWATHFLTFACFLSLLGADFYPLKLGDKMPEVIWIRDMWKAIYFYWPFVLIPAFTALPTEGRRTILKSWLGSAFAFCVLGVVNFFTGWPFPNESTLAGTYKVQNFYGSYLSYASIMIFPIFFAFDDWFEHRLLPRWVSGATAVLGVFTLVGTFSRTLWVALPIGLTVYFCMRMPRKWAIRTTIAIILAVSLALNLNFVKERVFSDRGVSQRTNLWKANLYFFKQRPITGVGWHHNMRLSAGYYQTFLPGDKTVLVGHAHSNYLEWLGGLGIIGLAAGLMWCFVVGKVALGASIGFFAAWVIFFINGITQVNFWEAKCIHNMVWAATWGLVFTLKGKKTV